MAKGRISSRLKKMEDRRNKQQAFLFVLLSIGFLILVILIGSKFFIEIAVWFGNLRTSSSSIISGDNVPPAPPRLVRSLEATNSA